MPNEYTLGGPPPQSRSEKILMKQNPGPSQSRIEELLKNSSAGRTVGVLVYKGTVETALSLPASGNEVGDVYHVNSDGSEWAWNGEQWEELGTTVDLSGKQDKISDLETIRSNAAAGAAKISCTESIIIGYGFTKNTGTYSKPSGGIPKDDLVSDVQASLGKADTALQKHQSLTDYATKTWVEEKGYQTASDVQTAIAGKVNATDVYTKTEVDQKLVGAMDYKGTKATVSELPVSGNATGDVWHIMADGSEWAWNGSAWEELGSAVDLSGYATQSWVNNKGYLTLADLPVYNGGVS